MAMDIHVYDTYVKAKDGHTMHFDVITDVQDHDKAIEYAKQWLETIGEGDAKVTVVGDIIGDPYKDTAGPALNTVIKLLSTVSIVFVSVFVAIIAL